MKPRLPENFVIGVYRPSDEADMIVLWQDCGLVVPWNNPLSDIARKTDDSPELFFTGKIDGHLVGSCMAGYDGHRGWIYFLAVKPEWQRHGLAALLIRHAETCLARLGCPKLELMVRDSNVDVVAFYKANGYRVDPVRVMSKRLQEDGPHSFLTGETDQP